MPTLSKGIAKAAIATASSVALFAGLAALIRRFSVLETPQGDEAAHIDGLIRDIQVALYDNERLPYVLTLCLDLCDRVGLCEKYGRWLRSELSGYRDYEELQNEFDDQEQFGAWIENWASHRLIRPYVKALDYSPERMSPEILPLPVNEMLIAFPVAQIARMIEDARDSNRQEFSYTLVSLGQQHFDRLKSVVDELSPGTQVPPDLQVFYTVSDLEQVLDGVRNTVLSLLSDARLLAA